MAEGGGDRQFEKILEVVETDDGAWAELPRDREAGQFAVAELPRGAACAALGTRS